MGPVEEITWDALDFAEMLREAGDAVVTALSGSETTEIAYALGACCAGTRRAAVLPEATSNALGAFRASGAIGEAEIVVVVGDDPVVERAPIVDLWIRGGAARRGGGRVLAHGRRVDRAGRRGGALSRAGWFPKRTREEAARGGAGSFSSGRAREVGVAHASRSWRTRSGSDKPGSGAFHLPATANALGVAAAGRPPRTRTRRTGADQALDRLGRRRRGDPSVRALAEQAERTIVVTMFHELAGGWADLILPATGALSATAPR